MIAFLFVCLLPTAVIAIAVPFLVFGLMLETSARRSGHSSASSPPVYVPNRQMTMEFLAGAWHVLVEHEK